jgi:hypothetical protein
MLYSKKENLYENIMKQFSAAKAREDMCDGRTR